MNTDKNNTDNNNTKKNRGYGTSYDLGSADAYYSRSSRPYRRDDTGYKVDLVDPVEIEEYLAGYAEELLIG